MIDEMRPRESDAADVMPQQERDHDERDEPEDEVALARMGAGESRRPHDQADDERSCNAREHEHANTSLRTRYQCHGVT